MQAIGRSGISGCQRTLRSGMPSYFVQFVYAVNHGVSECVLWVQCLSTLSDSARRHSIPFVAALFLDLASGVGHSWGAIVNDK